MLLIYLYIAIPFDTVHWEQGRIKTCTDRNNIINDYCLLVWILDQWFLYVLINIFYRAWVVTLPDGPRGVYYNILCINTCRVHRIKSIFSWSEIMVVFKYCAISQMRYEQTRDVVIICRINKCNGPGGKMYIKTTSLEFSLTIITNIMLLSMYIKCYKRQKTIIHNKTMYIVNWVCYLYNL